MIRFHKEGTVIIFRTLLLLAVVNTAVISLTESVIGYYIVGGISLIFLILILQFFRNPKRNLGDNENQLFAPVDGKVVAIEEVEETEYFKDKRIQISIFMSPINVHVTRYPLGGLVKFAKYHPGKFLVAWHPKSSTENERTTVVVENDTWGPVLFRQIAGAVARRIVMYAKEGATAKQSEDFGFIKFGSRVDVFVPLDAKITVSIDQAVTGGIDVIAER